MNKDVRKVTNDLQGFVEAGILTWEEIAKACLNYMSEDDVADMVRSNWVLVEDEDE